MVTVEPLQFDSPDTTALMFDEAPAGLGLSTNEGVPEQDTSMVVVGAVVGDVVDVLDVVEDDVEDVLVVLDVEVVADPVGEFTVSPIKVTSVCDRASPFIVAPDFITISPEGPASMVPSKTEVVSRVATPATCQKMF
jgi:hypothetical protein